MRTPAIAALSATALLLATALSGCGTSSPSGSSGLSAVTPSAGVPTSSAGPTDSPAPTATSTSTPTSGSGSTAAPTKTKTTKPPATPTYPTTAQAYATVTLSAYTGDNKTFLAAYTDAEGAIAFKFLGSFDKHWHFYKCGPDGALTDCFFDNNNGDRITVVVDPTVLGAAHATHNTSVDRTEFGTSADGMVSNFMTAVFDHNIYREKVLATAEVVSDFSHRAYPASSTLSDAPAMNPTGTFVTVADGVNSPFTFLVPDSKLGKAHAVEVAPS